MGKKTAMESYMTDRRRDQEEAWLLGLDTALEMVVKRMQKHIDKQAAADNMKAADFLHAVASELYAEGNNLASRNPFLQARINATKPRLPTKHEVPALKDPDTGSEVA